MKSISNDSSKWYKTPWTLVAIHTVCNSSETPISRGRKKELHVTNPILCLSHRKLFSLGCYGEWKKSDVRRLRYIVLHLTIVVFRIRYIFSLPLYKFTFPSNELYQLLYVLYLFNGMCLFAIQFLSHRKLHWIESHKRHSYAYLHYFTRFYAVFKWFMMYHENVIAISQPQNLIFYINFVVLCMRLVCYFVENAL